MTTKIPVELSSTPGIVDGSNATAITIDSSERVGIGTTSPVATLQVKTQADGNLAFQNSTSVTGGVKLNCFNDAANASSPFEIDGSSLQFNIASSIKARIDSDGLKFGSDTAAANALDDYEEGTWTPAFTGATGIAYSAQTGYYVKVGSLVTLMFSMVVSTAPTSGSNIYITMPFNPKGSGSGLAGTRWNYITGGTNSSAIQAVTSLHEYSTSAGFYSYNITSGAVYSNYTHYSTGVYNATLTYQID